jgi:hypothetical protein
MSFYTSVVRYGNSILYRGYDEHGKRIYKKVNRFQPTFYVQSKRDVGWKSIDGKTVAQSKTEKTLRGVIFGANAVNHRWVMGPCATQE